MIRRTPKPVGVGIAQSNSAQAAPVSNGSTALRVAVDCRVFNGRFDGIARLVHGLLDELCGLPGLQVALLTPPDVSPRYDLTGVLARDGVTRHCFPDPPTSLTQQIHWRAMLRATHPDVLFVPYQLSVPLSVNVPVVMMIYDCIFESKVAYAPSVRIWASYIAATQVLIRRAEVVCLSNSTRQDIRKYYRKQLPESNVVSGGVERGFLEPVTQAEIRAARAELDLPKRYFLHLGARRPHKNATHLVDVSERLAARGGDHDIPIVFAGPLDARWIDELSLRIAAGQLEDRCLTVGPVPERHLRALYAEAEALLFPSLIEGFGLPILEALALGTPVIASDIPVLRESGGPFASYVPPHDVDAWVDQIDSLMTRSAAESRRIREDGREFARARSWTLPSRRLLNVLRAESRRE